MGCPVPHSNCKWVAQSLSDTFSLPCSFYAYYLVPWHVQKTRIFHLMRCTMLLYKNWHSLNVAYRLPTCSNPAKMWMPWGFLCPTPTVNGFLTASDTFSHLTPLLCYLPCLFTFKTWRIMPLIRCTRFLYANSLLILYIDSLHVQLLPNCSCHGVYSALFQL